MEDRAGAATASVRVDGAPAEATLGGGELRWRRATGGGRGAGKRALSLEREVLGVEARGDAVVVRAFVAAGASRATSCASGAGAGGRKGAGRRRRRDYVIEMPDGEGAAAAWCERMTRCLDSFGTCAFSAQARRKLLSPVSILISCSAELMREQRQLIIVRAENFTHRPAEEAVRLRQPVRRQEMREEDLRRGDQASVRSCWCEHHSERLSVQMRMVFHESTKYFPHGFCGYIDPFCS